MKQYVLSISDEVEANNLLSYLRNLAYVKISDMPESKDDSPHKRQSLLDNPIPVKNFKKYSREELHER